MSDSSQARSAGSLAASLFAGLMIVASSGWADTIPAGIDVFATTSGTLIKVPPDFLCMSHAGFDVPAHGVAIATSPPGVLGESDTVIDRANAVNVPRGGSAGTGLRIVALGPEGDAAHSACGKSWTLTRSLGGIGQKALPKTMISVVQTAADRAHAPGSGGVEGDFDLIDTDGDGVPDTDFPGTADFVPGWKVRRRGDLQQPDPVVSATNDPSDGEHAHSVSPLPGCSAPPSLDSDRESPRLLR